MRHTLGVSAAWRWARTGVLLTGIAAVCVLIPGLDGQPRKGEPPPQSPAAWQLAVAAAARIAPQARIVILDLESGKLLASNHLADAARTVANPGSAMKPLALYNLVANLRWDPARRIACDRKLRIGSHTLACSHPQADPMDARLALAWSCNTYFATVAGTLAPGDLRGLIEPTGLLGPTGLVAGEATADFREPRTPDEIRLAFLGVDGVRVSPLEFAVAYRWLAFQLENHSETPAAQVVRAGLEDSASFGIAGAADLGGVPVAGKTGTASSTLRGPVHGWFICMAPARETRAIIAIYLPSGHGNDAARVAGELLAHSPLRKQ